MDGLRTAYQSGCTWKDVWYNGPDFQYGSYSTLDDYPLDQPPQHTARDIVFPKAFPSQPTIVVWITGFSMNSQQPWRVKTFATGVTTTEFTLHIKTWKGSILYSAGVAWVAYPANKRFILGGRFDADTPLDSGRQSQSGSPITGLQTYDCSTFCSYPPCHLLALDSVEMENSEDLSLSLDVKSTSSTMFQWSLTVDGRQARLYSVGITYILLTNIPRPPGSQTSGSLVF